MESINFSMRRPMASRKLGLAMVRIFRSWRGFDLQNYYSRRSMGGAWRLDDDGIIVEEFVIRGIVQLLPPSFCVIVVVNGAVQPNLNV